MCERDKGETPQHQTEVGGGGGGNECADRGRRYGLSHFNLLSLHTAYSRGVCNQWRPRKENKNTYELTLGQKQNERNSK